MRTTFKIALLLLMFMTCMGTVNAAEKNRQWTKEMLEYKHDYIVKTTGMSQAQREKFMPIYEAMEKEIFSVYRNAREQSKKVTATNQKVSDEDVMFRCRETPKKGVWGKARRALPQHRRRLRLCRPFANCRSLRDCGYRERPPNGHERT